LHLVVSIEHRQQMLAHVLSNIPEEACGLLAGIPGRQQVRLVQPVTNSLHSPVRFRMDAGEQLKAMLWMEQNGLELLGIYHSHPRGPERPSQTDIAEFYYPGVATLIWSPDVQGSWQLRAYAIQPGQVTEICLLDDYERFAEPGA